MPSWSFRKPPIVPSLASLLLVLLAACGTERGKDGEYKAGIGAEAEGPVVSGARLVMPAAEGRPGVAYATITGGATAVKLIGISTPAAQRVELHRTVTENNVARMEPADEIEIPAGGTVAMTEGGLHAMLYDMRPQEGATAPLTFTYSDGSSSTVDAAIETRGTAMSHEGM